MSHHKKKNDKINKYISENKYNDEVIIDAAMKLAEHERNVMDKHNITKGQQVTIYETPTNTQKI